MTLIVAIKYSNGVVIGADSRTTYGEAPLMREEPQKMEKLGKNTLLTGSGFGGAIDRILDNARSAISGKPTDSFEDIVNECENIIWAFYQKYKERYEADEEGPDFPMWVLATHHKILRIFTTGVPEEERYYICEGSGRPYGEYILQQRFKPDMTEGDAMQLVVYAILQTSRIDPSVGGKINVALIRSHGIENIADDQVDDILEDLTGAETPVERELEKIVGEIVEKRRWLNTVFKEKFGFQIFRQNEFAIARIQSGCRNESDFTDRISALSLLIDELNVSRLSKLISTRPDGSINILEAFLKEKHKDSDPAITTNLREIKALRSKKMPIHEDDPKIIQIVLKWGHKIPPNWAALWIQALQRYKDSITMLGQLLS